MALLVQKFGGTSVADVERIQAVAQRIAASRQAGHDLVIVVSAMGHTTDELTGLARAISSAPPRTSASPPTARSSRARVSTAPAAATAAGPRTPRWGAAVPTRRR